MTKVSEINLPEYQSGKKPDSIVIGDKLDRLIYENFPGKEIVVRCVGLQDHAGKSVDELASQILADGTDKYDKTREPLAADLIPKEHLDNALYGEPMTVDKLGGDMHLVIDDFYHGAKSDRGFSVRIDLVMIYDHDQLTMLPDIYPGHDKSDVFVFKNPADKKSALLGLIKIH